MDPRPESFVLTRIRLRHYRSIAACDVRPGPLTLLVGPNGAGKSNFLDALRFTSQALRDNLDNAIRDRGGVAEVRRRSQGHPTHFAIELSFSGTAGNGVYKFQVAAVKGGDYRVSHESFSFTSTENPLTEIGFAVRDGVLTASTEGLPTPATSVDRLYLVGVSGSELVRPIFDGLSAMQVYSVGPDTMRRPQPADSGDLLRRDGSNIASVLERLRRESPTEKARIEAYLSRVSEGVIAADRRPIDRWEQAEFRQEVSGASSPWTFPATSMSDGTLRALGVLTALFAPTDGVLAPIGIEEPESALHPAAAGLLLDALRDASRRRQVLATTHSPDLLDTPDLELSAIVGVRAIGGTSRLGRLDAVGRKALEEQLFTPGEMLRVDQLQPEATTQQLELFS